MNLGDVLRSEDIDPIDLLVIRHTWIKIHEDSGLKGIDADSSDDEVLAYTARQSGDVRRFPASPPPLWAVFLREGGNRARLWSVVENAGEISRDEQLRTFELQPSPCLSDLRKRLIIGWPSPINWRVNGLTAAEYPVIEIADAQPIRFPGFDSLEVDYATLQAVVRERRYSEWETALSAVIGIYLITDTSDGRQYVGKADGAERIWQRWGAYARNGHGDNVELQNTDPTNFRFSLLRVFDPATPTSAVNAAEAHFKRALDTVRHGLNRN